MNLILAALALAVSVIDYPIVAVRAPRYGDTTHAEWQEVLDPINGEPGSDLVLIHPDGTEEVLVDAGDKGCVLDPSPSLDGEWIYYSLIPDISSTGINPAIRQKAAKGGADIYKINVATREVVRLTTQVWTPATGVANWVGESTGTLDHINAGNANGSYLGYGIYNTGPCEVPGGRVVFTSSRNGNIFLKGFSFPNMQLFSMDTNGKNVECIGHLNVGSALHPVLLKNGDVMWSSWEGQGTRDDRNWGLWVSRPDGREWGPLMSAFLGEYAAHFAAQDPAGKIYCTLYYLNNNNGFGTIYRFPHQTDVPADLHAFHSPLRAANPSFNMTYEAGFISSKLGGFTPWGTEHVTQFSHHFDRGSYPTNLPGNERWGKVTHPAAGPDELLMVWSGRAPATHNMTPHTPKYQGIIVSMPYTDIPADTYEDFTIVRSDVNYNYQQPRPLLTWQEVYGGEPVEVSYNPNDGTVDERLPAGTPFGIVGTSSFYNRNSETQGSGTYNTIVAQGGDIGTFSNSQIHSVAIVQLEPQSDIRFTRNGGNLSGMNKGWQQGSTNHGNAPGERYRVIGEVPLRKFDVNGQPILDAFGDPDTSFAAKIPADVPFTFQVLDEQGNTLVQSQTWHQLRPGERRWNCGGCHAHANQPLEFSTTEAAKSTYQLASLLDAPRTYEYDTDVAPILEEHGCVECHSTGAGQSTWDLSDPATRWSKVKTKSLSQASPFPLALSGRLSKLMHKIRGVTHTGGSIVGDRMPPGGPYLSDEEARTIVRWIDTGATQGAGAFTDNIPPTLTIQAPARDDKASVIRVGAFDNHTRLNESTLKIEMDGVDITSSFTEEDSIWTYALSEPVESGVVTAEVYDNQGNVQRVERTFAEAEPEVPPDNPCEELEQELAEVQAALAAAIAQQQQDAALITQLEADVAELQAKIDAALEALE